MLRQYKQLIQKKKRHYQEVKLSQLENMKTEDPNSYWKFWKSLKPRNSTKGPTLSQFVNKNKSTLLMLTILTTIT